MTHAPLAAWLNLAGGLAIVGFGVWIATIRPRTPGMVAFAAFAIPFGGTSVANNGGLILHVSVEARVAIQAATLVVALPAAVALALLFPRPVVRKEVPLVAAAGLVAAVLLPFQYAALPLADADGTTAVALVSIAILLCVLHGYLALLALRFWRGEDAGTSRQIALSAVAVGILVGTMAGAGSYANHSDTVFAPEAPTQLAAFARLVAVVLAAAVWLSATRGREPRVARNTALALLVFPLLGLVHASLDLRGVNGVARVLCVAVLAYAVARHQLLGVDVKVRWTISKSTVAAVFVAAFFVASEGAQLLLGAGNEWVGLVGAGALVFAMAPLQRAAERLAERAVPSGASAARPEGRSPEALYLHAVRLALRDRRLTRDEEAHLHRLADGLGLSASRAHELLVEAERERDGVGSVSL